MIKHREEFLIMKLGGDIIITYGVRMKSILFLSYEVDVQQKEYKLFERNNSIVEHCILL